MPLAECDRARVPRMQIYGYWNQGGLDNVTAMLCYLVDQYFLPTGLPLPALVETPPTGRPRVRRCLTHIKHSPASIMHPACHTA